MQRDRRVTGVYLAATLAPVSVGGGRAENDGTGHVTSFPGLPEHTQALYNICLSCGGVGGSRQLNSESVLFQLCTSKADQSATRKPCHTYGFVVELFCLVHTHKAKSDVILSSGSS